MSDFFKGKVVAVAGGTGFVGTNLVSYLVSHGAEVRTCTHRNNSKINLPGVTYLQDLDLRLSEHCDQLVEGCDYVFMCAANSSGAAVMERTPLVHLTPNVIMNALMLEAAYKHSVSKFCFISSNTVYPVTTDPVSEDAVTYEFFSKYQIVGWMKLFSEAMCNMYSEHIPDPMDVLVVRPGNLFGPFDKYSWGESKVIAALIRRAVERASPFEVWGDGNDVKDFLFIDDFIEGMVSIFEKSEGYDVVNVASGVPVTIKQVLEQILIAADFEDADVSFDPSKPSMIPYRMIDTSYADQKYGWKAKTDLADGLKATVTWYRQFYKDGNVL